MFLRLQPFFIIAESPVHAGSGSELGVVDLPIQRERYTNFPKIEASGLKGCIREAFRNSEKDITINSQKIKQTDKIDSNMTYIDLVFGPEEGEAYAGAISFTDAKILLFPVKSLKGVFAWITCPMVLNRFIEDMKIAKAAKNLDLNLTNLENTIPEQTTLLISGKVILEEYAYEVKENNETSKIAERISQYVFPSDGTHDYWKNKLAKDLVILPDDDFMEFVSTSTDIITRTKIDIETGTVQTGALWTEEYLPQDTVLYSIAMASPLRVKDDNQKGMLKGGNTEKEAANVIEFLRQGIPDVIQIGGNQTTGKGLIRIQLFNMEGKND